ncbi:MAG: hypothetical protein EAZ92_16865 [Candidatus Kapaibacterium sp.]|nr:MAG: hypothetical protein EAZ92_16865 [Candidatus Kapabacteria bacterium]
MCVFFFALCSSFNTCIYAAATVNTSSDNAINNAMDNVVASSEVSPLLMPTEAEATIATFSPTIGTSGTVILVTGANLEIVQRASIGTVSVPFLVQSSANLLLGPIGAVRSGLITLVTVTNGTTNITTTATRFTFIGEPTVSSLVPDAPTRSGIGQIITINGNNFYGTPRENLPAIQPQVNIGSVGASSVQVVAPSQMLVSFPSATSGILRIQAWGGSITMTTANVEILPPPVISGVSPTTLAPGFIVGVTGANFLHTSQVLVGGIPALSFTVNSPNRVSVIVPPNARGGISITTPGGTVSNATVISVISPPSITMITPTTAQVGTPILLQGTNFINVSTVLIGGIRASFTISSEGQITAIIPPNGARLASQATVSVTAIGGTITAPQRITALPALGAVLTGFSPTSVLLGDTLTLTGINLPQNLPPNPPNTSVSVRLNGILAQVLRVTVNTIALVVPVNLLPISQNSTTASIELTLPDGSTTASFLVPVRAPTTPALTSFTPNIGGTNTSIVITGQNLDIVPRGTILGISIGGVPVRSFVVVSPTRIIATLGTLSTVATSGTLTITTPSGILTSPQIFRYEPTYVPPVPVQERDSLALVALYNATGGSGWTNRTNWLQDYVSTWFGVRVENGRVVELRLPSNNLSGQIAQITALANLDALRLLDLSDNTLAGTLPPALASLRSLEVLNLSGNIFVGEFGQTLCGAARLRDLRIARNRLQGELGDILCCLPRIERADLNTNLLRGGLSRCLASVQTLLAVDASNNQLSDTLPSWLGDAPVLEELRLRGNRFRGTLPAEWGRRTLQRTTLAKQTASAHALEGLTVLDLGQNQLSGTLPVEWSGLTALRNLQLDSNAFTGAVPLEWQNLAGLRNISLANNRFTNLPDLAQIRRLDTLHVEGNALNFAALEANSLIRLFTYSPQSETGSSSTTIATIDALFQQRFRTGGTQNRYEWRKMAVSGGSSLAAQTIFPATNDGIMRIPAFQPTDTGEYRCFITNTLVPNLTLTSATVRVLSANPTMLPGDVVLISPVRSATEVALRPVLAWVPAQGASNYELELSTNQTFTPTTATIRDRAAQTLDGLLAGRLERLAPLLQPETRYFWRVRAVNSFGASAWSDVRDLRDFRTVRADAALSVETVNFGDVPRLDTAQTLMRITNISNEPITLNDVRLAPRHFAANLALLRGAVIAPGQAFALSVGFLPQDVGVFISSVSVGYTLAGTNAERSFDARLTGRGTALKVIPPNFQDVLLGRSRVASAQIINRTDAVVKVFGVAVNSPRTSTNARFVYEYLPSGDTVFVGARDTAALVLRCSAVGISLQNVGALAQGLIRFVSNIDGRIDSVATALSGTTRILRSGEVLARLAARMIPASAPPGAPATLELYLRDSTLTTLADVQRVANTVQAQSRVVMSFSQNVAVLQAISNTTSNTNVFVRRVRNSAPQNRTERIAVLLADWDVRNNRTVIQRIPCVAVAGEIDETKLVIEDVDWSGATLDVDDANFGTFRSEACTAGGKRLVTTAVRTSLTALAPNPAKDAVNIAYSVREDGFVELALVDVRGELVQMILRKEQHHAGEFLMEASVQNLSQGAYFLRLRAADVVLTKQVQIVR